MKVFFNIYICCRVFYIYLLHLHWYILECLIFLNRLSHWIGCARERGDGLSGNTEKRFAICVCDLTSQAQVPLKHKHLVTLS